MIRSIALLLALILTHPALAQTAPPPAPNPSPAKATPAKVSAAKPAPAKVSPAKPALKKPAAPTPDAGAASADAAAAAQHGPCIGVISHLGPFVLQNIGMTVFTNEFKEVPIESWALDDLVVARVRAAAGTRIAVRRIAYAASAFDPFDHPASRLFRNANEDLKSVVQSIAPGGGCERYVVVIRGQSEFAGTNQRMEGLGVINRDSLLLSRTYLFALTSIIVYDGHTFDVLKHGAGSTGEDKILSALLGTNPVRGPSREVKDFAWPPSPDATANLRDQLRTLLADSLDKALPELLAP